MICHFCLFRLYLFFLLTLSSPTSGRELTCDYDTDTYAMWPKFNYCKVSSVDLSEGFKTVEQSFSGTPEQKAATSVVKFESLDRIDFLPKQILSDFPRLNGIIIENCKTFTTLRNDLFSEDFGAIQYLGFYKNQIATIEADAFQHLPNLKRINLSHNQLRSLPHQIFKNNSELAYIGIYGNKINSITPDFFQNLNELQYVDFENNQCIHREFGCVSRYCSVSQSQLNSELADCYNNCLNDRECAAKSGKLEN
jgi:hypothetical protein